MIAANWKSARTAQVEPRTLIIVQSQHVLVRCAERVRYQRRSLKSGWRGGHGMHAPSGYTFRHVLFLIQRSFLVPVPIEPQKIFKYLYILSTRESTSDAVIAIDVISTAAVLTGPRLVLRCAICRLRCACSLPRGPGCRESLHVRRGYRMPQAEKEVESRPPSR